MSFRHRHFNTEAVWSPGRHTHPPHACSRHQAGRTLLRLRPQTRRQEARPRTHLVAQPGRRLHSR